jgi:predicted enzyme related to lactoylglutathione lyase
MPERTSYAEGTPSWVDLSSPDVEASSAFYGSLFGWQADAATADPEESGGYAIFTLRGKRVAGVMPVMSPEQPPAWSTYIAVDDADATVAKAKAAGGQIVVEPMDVMQAGRMAFFVDPTGAFIGIWQAGEHTGAELVNEPGCLTWNDLATRDAEAAKAFYPTVFGVEAAAWDGPSDNGYTVWNVAGSTVGGLIQMDERWSAEAPASWTAYFMVEDADATTAQAVELGGTALVEPFDAPDIGRIALLTDAHGAVFGVMSPAERPDA